MEYHPKCIQNKIEEIYRNFYGDDDVKRFAEKSCCNKNNFVNTLFHYNCNSS